MNECAFMNEDSFCSILAIKIQNKQLCEKCYARHVNSFEKLYIEDTDDTINEYTA